MKFKNYRNHYNRSSRIYSEEDLWNMKVSDLFEYENDIMAQNNQVGIPESKELQASDNVIWIESYTRDDGTQVEGHWRSLPDGAHYINPERQNKSRKQNRGTTGAAAYLDDKANEIINNGIENYLGVPRGSIEYYKNGINEFLEKGFNKQNKMSLWEEMLGLLFEKLLNPIFPMASNDTVNGMHNMKVAKNNKGIQVFDNVELLQDIDLQKSLSMLHYSRNLPVIVYDTSSDESKKFSNCPQINHFLVSNYDNIIKGEKLPSIISLDFTYNLKKKSAGYFEKADKYFFLQHAYMVNPKINDNGVFTATLFDIADFEKRKVSFIADIPNNWGNKMQEKKQYKNHINVIKIKKRLSF